MSKGISSVRRWTRAAVLATARDVTADVAGRSALVIAPHPDDETLGCGATIMRKVKAGTKVTVLVATDGRNSHSRDLIDAPTLMAMRRAEMAEAALRLGLPDDAVRWAGFVDGSLSEYEDDLAATIAGHLAELRPEEVYATCAEEPHPDHAAVGRAARRAVAAAGGPSLFEYPVWLWDSWPLSHGDRAGSTARAAGLVLRRGAVRVRADDPGAKMHALDAHATQLRAPAGFESPDWFTLPPAVLAAASEPSELFFPVTAG